MLRGLRWSIASPLSTRHVEALLEARGVEGDHSPINWWAIKDSPQLEEAFPRRQRPVWVRWRRAEPSSRGKGAGKSVYRAVATHGQTIDGLLTEPRETEAALTLLKKAMRRPGRPETLTMEGRAATDAAITRDPPEYGTAIVLRQEKYLTTRVDHDHRGVHRVTGPMLGGKSCAAAPSTLVGMELMPMLRTGPLTEGR